MITKGERYRRQVTEADSELFDLMKNFLENSLETKKGYWHLGWEDIGNLSTYLTENYEIVKKVP